MTETLTHLSALRAKATKGPWKAKRSIHGNKYKCVYIGKGPAQYSTLEMEPTDAEFITAAANTDFTALAEKMARMEAALRRIAVVCEGSNNTMLIQGAATLARKALEDKP